MPKRSLRQIAADTPLARWLVDVAEKRGWTSGRQAAKYLGVNQAAFATWLRGEIAPGYESQQQLSDVTGVPLETIATLANASRPSRREAPDSNPPPMAREFARQVAEELARLGRGEEARIPVFSAGPGAAADAESWRDVVTTIRHGRLQPVEVVGDCLYPRLVPGWIVWINPEGSPRDGDVVAITIDGERGFREYEKKNGTARLTARRHHDPIDLPRRDVDIVGVVELVQHSP